MSRESISVAIIILIAILGIFLNWTNEKTPPETLTVCPQDMKLCPDGSYVGRTSPDCSFIKCPEIPENQFEEALEGEDVDEEEEGEEIE